jgi:hypothetical protein
MRIRPTARGEFPVPAQQRRGRHEQRHLPGLPRQHPAKRRKQRPIGLRQLRTSHLTLQHPQTGGGAAESRSPSPALSDAGVREVRGIAGATSRTTRPRYARTVAPRSLTLPRQPPRSKRTTPTPPHLSFRHPQAALSPEPAFRNDARRPSRDGVAPSRAPRAPGTAGSGGAGDVPGRQEQSRVGAG